MTLRLVSDLEKSGPRGAPVLKLDIKDMHYGTVPVLGAVQLSLTKGETVALTGPSGVGKSTLLRIVAGLESRYRGTCDAPDRISFVFQEPTLMPWRSVVENLTLTANISESQAVQALDEVGLAGRGADFPGQLSLGQQRRLSLARAFAAQPDLLLLDEPFVSLDPKLADEMMNVFEGLRQKHQVTTLLVTHVEAEATRLADRVLRLAGQPARLA